MGKFCEKGALYVVLLVLLGATLIFGGNGSNSMVINYAFLASMAFHAADAPVSEKVFFYSGGGTAVFDENFLDNTADLEDEENEHGDG